MGNWGFYNLHIGVITNPIYNWLSFVAHRIQGIAEFRPKVSVLQEGHIAHDMQLPCLCAEEHWICALGVSAIDGFGSEHPWSYEGNPGWLGWGFYCPVMW